MSVSSANPASTLAGTPGNPGMPVIPAPGRSNAGHPGSGADLFRPARAFASATSPSDDPRHSKGTAAFGAGGAAVAAFREALGSPFTNETPGWMTNAVIPYAKIMRPIRDGSMDPTMLYQLIISMREAQSGTQFSDAQRSYRMLSVPAWNAYQARSSDIPDSPEDVMSAEEEWTKWHLEGPVRSENGQDEPPHHSEVGAHRVLNMVAGGWGVTFNAFGSFVRPGTRLYLMLKQVDVHEDATYVVNPMSGTLSVIGGRATKRTHKPFQLVFYGDYHHDIPPLSERMYTDEFGIRHLAKLIYIGTANVHEETATSATRATPHVERSLSAIAAMPHISLIVDIDQ